MRYWKSLMQLSAQDWHVSDRWAQFSFWWPLIGAVLIAATRLNKDVYRFLLQDDGPIEWIQFACFVLAFIFALGVAIRAVQTKRYDQFVLFLIFAGAMFFVAGEEISWGQRIFGWETPAELAEVNKQNETTLHNIGEVLTIINFGMMMMGLVGMVAYVLNKRLRLERYWQEVQYFLVPPFFLSGSFFVIFLYKFVRFVFLPESAFTITKYGEWAELCFAYGLCVFAYLNYRRLNKKQSDERQISMVTTETF